MLREIIRKLFLGDVTEVHSRTILARINIIFSFLVKGASIIIGLILVPITIKFVNASQYGIWLTISSIISWFSFLDIGFGHGLRNKLAEAKALGEFNLAKKYVSTSYFVLSTIFIIVWILFYIGSIFLDWSYILNSPESDNKLLQTSVVVFAGFFCMQIVLKLLSAILNADQKNAKASFLDTLSQLFILVGVFIVSQFTHGTFLTLVFLFGATPVLVLTLCSFYLFNKDYEYLSPTISFIDFSIIKDVMGLGLKFFFIQFAGVIIFQMTNIVILHTVSSEAVTVYNIAYKYFFIFSMVFTIFISPYWSAFTDAYMKRDFVWMKKTLLNIERVWLWSIPVLLVLLLLSNLFYKIWLGDIVVVPFGVSVFMAIYVLFFTKFNLYIFLINGIGKVKMQMLINVLLCVLYLPFSIISCRYFGLQGMLIINILVAVTHSIVGKIQIKKLLNETAVGIWNQ